MLRIVTDGAADMPEGWLERYDIQILPLMIRFEEQTYLQGVNIDNHSFYRMVKEKHTIPKTSLPSPRQIMDFYRSIALLGDEILSIHIASKLSGTFATVQTAAQELADEYKIFPFDSGAGSAAMGFMCREARILSQKGWTVQNILNRLTEVRQNLTIIFTLENLEFARLNGRVNALQEAVVSMLQIKPIIYLRDGLLQMGEKVRTRHRSIERVIHYVVDRVGNQPVQLAVVHAHDTEAANSIMERLRSLLNVKEMITTELSIPVAANLGPGTVGIVAIPLLDE